MDFTQLDILILLIYNKYKNMRNSLKYKAVEVEEKVVIRSGIVIRCL